jgi:transposase-like protein
MKPYSAKFKFKIVLESLKTNRSLVELGEIYGVHPQSISKWRSDFLEKGADIFEQDGTVLDYEKRINDLELLVGKKEIEIQSLRNNLNHIR